MRILISKLNTEIHRTINAKLRKELDALLNEFAPSHVSANPFQLQEYRMAQRKHYNWCMSFHRSSGAVPSSLLIIRHEGKLVGCVKFRYQSRINSFGFPPYAEIITVALDRSLRSRDLSKYITKGIKQGLSDKNIKLLFWHITKEWAHTFPEGAYTSGRVFNAEYSKKLNSVSDIPSNDITLRKATDLEKKVVAKHWYEHAMKRSEDFAFMQMKHLSESTFEFYLKEWREYSWGREWLMIEYQGKVAGSVSLLHLSTGLAPTKELCQAELIWVTASKLKTPGKSKKLLLTIENHAYKQKFENLLCTFPISEAPEEYELNEVLYVAQ
jgi:N-acetylglutamate synthase-like GNAT family acetyltransferase